MLRECQLQVLALAKDVPRVKVLYNALDMHAPNIDLVVMQQEMMADMKLILGTVQLRKAILVADTRTAYLARIAFGEFGEGEYRVFYDNRAQAQAWLDELDGSAGT